ncbi:MAG TPA: chemotaxis protein CheW [Methanospirillum sp.]|uniref:chemotaxis protein CheW n=1 Tax=Methanospirillum sp. TaxID=45200 RepID=UPI002C04C33E|nr:chemotaxis protein CheW [Methanospirillum sp.]HOJ95390.1 chemotaxis protein CheW [Methanospirillum sp.]HOL40482.1 chemotaxis protein CheW [Methanospirillum sp.]HPP76713.1 chemotaxis protein CheW [Methanospirillum sp.]
MAGNSAGVTQSFSQDSNGIFTQKASGKANEESAEESFQVVEFLLGQEHFAIDLFDVKEVVEYTRITKLPNSPSYIKGIIDLRGEITTIIDLKQQLGITSTHTTSEEETRIIVLDDRITHSKIGIMVDDVLTVSTYYASQVDETATSGDDSSHILGIIKKKVKDKDKESTELVIWLDVKTLLRDMDQIK